MIYQFDHDLCIKVLVHMNSTRKIMIELFIGRYILDVNPIENIWEKIKDQLKKKNIYKQGNCN